MAKEEPQKAPEAQLADEEDDETGTESIFDAFKKLGFGSKKK